MSELDRQGEPEISTHEIAEKLQDVLPPEKTLIL